MPVKASQVPAEIIAFIEEEAQILDEARFQDWLDLFAEDGFYWLPSARGQTDPYGVPSIICEDRPLLSLRIERLKHPAAFAVAPMPRTMHLIGNSRLVEEDAAKGELVVASNLMVAEYRENRQRVFAGQCSHRLRRDGESFKIVLKRIDLLDCDGIHEFMSVPL